MSKQASGPTGFDELVRNAAFAAALVFGVKIAASFVLARIHDAPTQTELWMGFVPHLLFRAPEHTFTSILRWSTVAMAVAALLLALVTLAQVSQRSTQRLLGRLVAPVVALETLAIQVIARSSASTGMGWLWLAALAGVTASALFAVPLWADYQRQQRSRPRPATSTYSTEAQQ